MSIDTSQAAGAQQTNPADGQRVPLPPPLQLLAAEIETFHRELPRLLDEGEAGRYVVVRDDRIHGVWDTFRDAIQYGYEKFDDGRFLAQKIDPRLGPVLARHFGPLPDAESP